MAEIRLQELAPVIMIGQIMNRVSYKDGEEADGYEKEEPLLLPSAISGGLIRRENLGKTRLKKPVKNEFLTRENDIIIKLSSPYNCALITEADEDLIVPSFCAIIRGVDANQIDIHYLTGYLNSAYALAKLMAGIDTSGIAMLRKKSLEDLVIERPGTEREKAAGDAYWVSCQKEYLLQQMTYQQHRVGDSIIIETLKGVTDHG